MMLRSITVQGWRCFADPMTAGPFADGINVVHAPNAAGKSTLLEALLRGFFDGHRVGGQDVETMRPWGRALAPEVTLEFTDGGAGYRLRKRFLDGPVSELLRSEGGKFVRFCEGEKADDFVRGLFSSTPPGRGLSKPAHWGLAQVLLAPQGRLELQEISGNTVADIQASLGAQVSGGGSGPLEEKVEALYLRFFTPKGKPRGGKEAPRVEEMKGRLETLDAQRRRVLDELEAFENASRRVEDLRAQRAQARRDAESLEQEAARARQQAQAYGRLAADRDVLRERAGAAEARHAELHRRVEGILGARRDLAGAREALERLKADIASGARELENLQAREQKARARLDDVRKGRREVDLADKEAEDAQRFVQAGKSLAEIQGLLGKIRQAGAELEGRRKELCKAVAPDAGALKAIRKAVNARDEAQVRLDAALITLEIVPRRHGELEVLAAEETGRRPLAPGTTVLVKGAPEVVVDLEGVARIRARGPAGTAEELREEVQKAVRKIGALTAGFGTADLDELEARAEHARGVQQKVSEARTRLETLLAGRTEEQIEQERRRLEKTAEETAGEHPAWSGAPPDADALRSLARTVKQTFITRVEDAELELKKAEEALQASTLKIARLQAQLDLSGRSVKSVSDKLEELQNDGMDDPKRQEALAGIALQWDAARSALGRAEKELSEFQDDPRLAVDKLDKQLAATRERASQLLEQLKTEEGRVEQIASAGHYSCLSRVEEEMADLRARADAEQLRIDAVRLLRDTVRGCKARILSDLRRPVEESATRMLQRISGPRLGSVRLADGLHPQSVAPRAAAAEVDLADLSGGEKEQVHLAVRLALAEAVAGTERRFAVLDDILTATDTGRLARVLSILEEAAGRLQLFVLTCHPERYRGLADAAFHDLEKILGRS